MEEKISFIYIESFISIEDKYELEDISIFSIEADCDFKFQGSYDNIWISFEKDTNEMYRVIEIPDNVYATGECGNSTHTLDSFNTFDDALFFFENLKTISFKKLKKLAGYPDNENLCYFNDQKNKIIGTDDNKVRLEYAYHDNGMIKIELEVVNNKAHGFYKFYHDNGQLNYKVKYDNHVQVDGLVDSYDEDGNLIRTVYVRNGNKNGPFKEFYPSGALKKEGEYIDDEIIGEPIEYFEDGSIMEYSNDNNGYDDSFHLGYILGQISYEDEYESEDITLFCIQVDYDDCDFGFEGIIWISFDEETDEPYRVIQVPDDFYLEENIGGNYTLGAFDSYDEATIFIENLKTISFNKLKKLTGYPANENLCYFRNNKG